MLKDQIQTRMRSTVRLAGVVLGLGAIGYGFWQSFPTAMWVVGGFVVAAWAVGMVE